MYGIIIFKQQDLQHLLQYDETLHGNWDDFVFERASEDLIVKVGPIQLTVSWLQHDQVEHCLEDDQVEHAVVLGIDLHSISIEKPGYECLSSHTFVPIDSEDLRSAEKQWFEMKCWSNDATLPYSIVHELQDQSPKLWFIQSDCGCCS